MSTRNSSSISWGILVLILNGGNGYLLVSPWPYFSTLINDSPQGFFGSSHGLCPLSRGPSLTSLLFVIVMEALNRMLSRAMVGGYLSEFQGDPKCYPLEISHLIFAMIRLLRVMQITTKSI